MATEQFRFFATTAKGVEGVLEKELKSIGIPSVQLEKGGVSFLGSLDAGYRACLWSRTASRVLLPLKSFSAKNPDQLYGGVRSIHWTDHLSSKGTLSVDFVSTHSAIQHTQFGAQKVKDAIVDQFRAVCGERPSVRINQPDLRIHVYLNNDEATVSLDLSGESLHRRGYRQDGVAAPLKENLAAALLLMMDWPLEDHWGFIDPMCGSGTLPIEAALIRYKIAPAYFRSYFGFLGWQGHIPQMWKRLKEEAESSIRDEKGTRNTGKILGFDANFRAIRSALKNSELAHCLRRVHFEKQDFSACEKTSDHGLLIVNPPYGERLGEEAELVPLYEKLGDLLKQRFKGWKAGIFTGSRPLANAVGLRTSQKIPLYNGPIECRLLKYDLY